MSKSKNNIYRPFEYLFYRIECLYDYIGVGGFYDHVALAVSLFQMGNLVFIYSLVKNLLKVELGFYLGAAIWILLIIFNIIYFKESKIKMIFNRYKNEDRSRKIFLGFVVLGYVILSIILFIISQRGI
jgi:membrane protease YdiL (CAAX protease family)